MQLGTWCSGSHPLSMREALGSIPSVSTPCPLASLIKYYAHPRQRPPGAFPLEMHSWNCTEILHECHHETTSGMQALSEREHSPENACRTLPWGHGAASLEPRPRGLAAQWDVN